MKYLLCFLFSFIVFFTNKANVLVVEGKYQNKNIYIKNYFGGSGVGFCITEIKVNGKIIPNNLNSSAIEVDLTSMNLSFGENVVIQIIHKNDCTPIVLNAEVLKPRPTFEIISMNITPSGILKWETKNECGSLPYTIEQYKWNKWVIVGEVIGVGTPDYHQYSFQVSPHSGDNKFRLKQTGLAVVPKISLPVVYHSSTTKPSYTITKDFNFIKYSSETSFEIYDVFGLVVKKGFSKETDISNLAIGNYYLCYDNQIVEFNKKKK